MKREILNQALSSYLTENPWLIAILIWVVIIKGFALWYSSQRKQKIWFMAILVVNTLGILEVIYLGYVYYSNRKLAENSPN